MRRWTARPQFNVDGVWFRVVPGYKSPEDLKLEMLTPKRKVDGSVGTKWIAVHMSLGALLADFFYENEDILYPPEDGFLGGEYHSKHLRQAETEGYEAATKTLKGEVAKKASRIGERP